MSGHRKNKTLLFSAVCIFLLCLLQVACAPNGEVDDPESNSIDPDKFALDVKDAGTNRNNFIAIKITPGSAGMCLGEFFVTTSLEEQEGIARGSSHRTTKGFDYDSPLDKRSLENLFLTNQQSHCLEKENAHFAQGEAISFRIKAIPGAAIKKGDTYTLTVKVERKGDNPHTETQSIVLTAKQDGVDTKEQTEEASTSNTSLQMSTTALDTVSDRTTLPINHPIPSTDLAIPAEEATTIEARPPILVSDPDLPATTSGTPPNTNPGQRTEVSDITENVSPSSANASAQQPASHQFAVTLSDATRRDGVRNFVLVTIRPNKKGMALSDFFVTASLSDPEGTMMGSSSKKNGFFYNKLLTACSVGELLLENVNCLGAQDTAFTSGGAILFKIEVRPSATLKQGDNYTLTVQIAYTGGDPHTATESVSLTAAQKSPQKKKKRATPRK